MAPPTAGTQAPNWSFQKSGGFGAAGAVKKQEGGRRAGPLSGCHRAQGQFHLDAGVHVGVVSVANGDRAPLTVPVWYGYEPGGLVSFITGRASQKAQRIDAAGRFSLCAQTEAAPYKYVSVEGSVVVVDDPVDRSERRDLPYRYLGTDLGDLYLAATEADAAANVTIRMRPEHWLSFDYAKQFG